MSRKFTIKVTDESGKQTVSILRSKKQALQLARQLGARKERLEVEFIVEGGGARQSETIIKQRTV